MEGRSPSRALGFAEALPQLQPAIVEEVLAELTFLKDPATIPAMERFIFREAHGSKSLVMAVQVLAALAGSERAEQLLGAVLADNTLDLAVRRAALNALMRSPSSSAGQTVDEYLSSTDDVFANECRRAKKAAAR
jgi:hypothetical protein